VAGISDPGLCYCQPAPSRCAVLQLCGGECLQGSSLVARGGDGAQVWTVEPPVTVIETQDFQAFLPFSLVAPAVPDSR
jgi:hypothetical protein